MHMDIYIYIYIHTYIYLNIYIYIYTYMCMYTYIYLYKYIYVHLYIYIYIHRPIVFCIYLCTYLIMDVFSFFCFLSSFRWFDSFGSVIGQGSARRVAQKKQKVLLYWHKSYVMRCWGSPLSNTCYWNLQKIGLLAVLGGGKVSFKGGGGFTCPMSWSFPGWLCSWNLLKNLKP